DSTKQINGKNEEYIKRLLRTRIEWGGVFICVIGPRTHTRTWVNWEIAQAAKKGKRIIGVYILGIGQTKPILPEKFKQYACALVRWRGNQIIDAIESKLNNFPQAEEVLQEPNKV
ncbi:MAG: TIR domain-containing protein, partial [Bacteroidota bacterium]